MMKISWTTSSACDGGTPRRCTLRQMYGKKPSYTDSNEGTSAAAVLGTSLRDRADTPSISMECGTRAESVTENAPRPPTRPAARARPPDAAGAPPHLGRGARRRVSRAELRSRPKRARRAARSSPKYLKHHLRLYPSLG